MATFQEIRDYLETHYDQLAQSLGTNDEAEFRVVFKRLQNDWNKLNDADVMQEITLQEMNKYPLIWNALVAAHLVDDEQQAALLPARATHPAPDVSGASPIPLKSSRRTDQHQNNIKPSQPVVDRLAIWDKRIATGKEILTGVLGTLIVLVTLIVVLITIASVNNQISFSAGKDVLLFMNGLVGVVLGYYFGRVPADVRAEKAESETRSANRSRDRVLSKVGTVLDEANRSPDRGVSPGGVNLAASQVDSLRDLIYQYSE